MDFGFCVRARGSRSWEFEDETKVNLADEADISTGLPLRPLETSVYVSSLSASNRYCGPYKGASQGEGLGNAFLSHIQAVDGMFHIVRAFDNDEVLHVDDSIDPVRDLSKSVCSSSLICV